ncbi:MAG: hypothetical protein WBY94_22145, partial [Polyangiaceae bacterium]
ALAREPSVVAVPLEPLTHDQVAEYLVPILGQPPSEPILAKVFDKTKGNPLLVSELVHVLRAKDWLSTGQVATSALVRNDGVRSAILFYLASLSEEATRALAAASVCGLSFELAPLATVLGATNASVLSQLDVLEAARIVARSRSGSYSFTYPLVRDTLYARISASEKARLHAAVAGTLEAQAGACDRERAAQIAHHLVMAAPIGDVARAVAWSVRAAELAEAAGDDAGAVQCAERALGILAFAQTPTLEDRARLLAICGRLRS